MIPARLRLVERHASSACAWRRSLCSSRNIAVRAQAARHTSRAYSSALNAGPDQPGPSSGLTEAYQPSGSTKVDKIIRDTIKATGPMPVSTYMQLCLSHPTEGYYMNRKNAVFGLSGDFITSPEISQVFGELVAVWHLSRWIAASRPKKLRIIELGPGRGTLMDDALRTWAQFKDCIGAITSLHLVETSPFMREMQKDKLGRYTKKGATKEHDLSVTWHDSVEEILEQEVNADTYTMLIAHEFFDALPVHLIEKCEDGWHDVLINSQPDLTAKEIIKDSLPQSEPPLRFVRSSEPSPSAMLLGRSSPRFKDLPIGARAEVSPVSFKLARQVAELLNNPKSAGGSALIIDYGKDHVSGGSLRAFKKHQIVDIFETPGECDLTANVDFAYLKEAIGDAATSHGPISQAAFLQNMNMEARVAKLIFKAKKDKNKRTEVAAAARRLVDPTGMGQQYMVLGVTATGAREAEDDEEGDVWPFVPGIKSW